MQTPIATFSDGTPVPFDGQFHVDPSNPLQSIRCREAWKPAEVLKIISGGNTAYLGLLPNNSVLKYPADKDDRFSTQALAIEHCILSTLGNHERIVRYMGKHPSGLCFKFEVNGDVKRYMSQMAPRNISHRDRIRWSIQATEALVYVHSRGVIHCDIHPSNFLIDDRFDLRLCDFSGSLFGNLDGTGMESVRYFLPRDPHAIPNIRSDLFALGSLIYFIMSGHDPYDDLSEDEVSTLYSRAEFPNTESIACGCIIVGCWNGKYNNAEDVLKHLLNTKNSH